MDIQNFLQNLIFWFLSGGVKIIVILVVTIVISQFFRVFIEKVINKQIRDRVDGEKKKRAKTLISIFGGTLKFIIWITALLMILPEFGINIAPILAGLGLVGLAVGMAARDIISDFISGLFILLEGQYHIGDKVKIAGLEGRVKEITLRRTIIEEETGLIHSVPNGQIKAVTKKQD
ncbi:MAG: mechanosensitive ion channel [bacterium]|nr:mechanosensitive ion channel [bacterium]